jgi:hypothetical protein
MGSEDAGSACPAAWSIATVGGIAVNNAVTVAGAVTLFSVKFGYVPVMFPLVGVIDA